MSEDARATLASLVRAVRAHLELEHELGGSGLPVPEPSGPKVAPVVSPPAREPISDRARQVNAGRDAAVSAAVPPPAVGPEASAAPQSPADKRERLRVLAGDAAECRACALHEKRTQAVFARGDPDAEIVFVGEGPGYEEDLKGQPFVGPAGQLLDRMIAAMGYGRDAVYICNVVKCRPPGNRTPEPAEAIACARYLVPQIELVAPKLIVALGRCAAIHLGVAGAAGPWRGRWGAWHGVPVMPTYHPAFLLRSPEFKRVVWQDLQRVMERLGRTPPPRGKG